MNPVSTMMCTEGGVSIDVEGIYGEVIDVEGV